MSQKLPLAAHGTMCLNQNFPGPGTLAKNDDGSPMHDWWVYLFY